MYTLLLMVSAAGRVFGENRLGEIVVLGQAVPLRGYRQ